MQLTFASIYLIFYIIILWCFLLSLVIYVPIFFISHVSFNTSFSFLKNYTKSTGLIFLLFFLLSGLPPVGIFFLKLNIIIYLLTYWNLFYIILVYFILFFNMLFYLQILKFKKQWTYLSIIFKSDIYKLNAKDNSLLQKPEVLIFKKLINKESYYVYNITYIIFSILLLFFFSIFFFSDIFICILNIIV